MTGKVVPTGYIGQNDFRHFDFCWKLGIGYWKLNHLRFAILFYHYFPSYTHPEASEQT